MEAIVELPEFSHRAQSLITEGEKQGIINYLARVKNPIYPKQKGMNWQNSPSSCLKTMVHAMSEFFNSIKQGMEEAVDFTKGKCPKAVIHEFSSVDVKNIRSKIGMSQTEFSSAFGISVSTL